MQSAEVLDAAQMAKTASTPNDADKQRSGAEFVKPMPVAAVELKKRRESIQKAKANSLLITQER